MCGLMGRFGGPFDAERALGFLARRGPDNQGTWSSDDNSVSLLHCRLAIVDEDRRSDQPFRDATHGIVVSLNGEIYNYRSLRRDYSDFSFRTQSDTEVIVAAYVKEGIAGLNRLNGMFALALVDERRRRVFLARDAVGKKPLYLFDSPEGLFFGTSLLPLIACSGAASSIDTEAASFFWRRGYISPDSCAVIGGRPVLPGTVLEFDYHGHAISNHRIETTPLVRYRGEPTAEVAHTIHELLVQAVEQRLENNPHPTALLSGGIDSTVVTELAAERLRGGDERALKVITLGSMIPCTQDEYYARYAAKRLGLDVEIVHPPRRNLLDAITRAMSVQDEPLGMPSYFFLFQLIEAAAVRGRVLLTGDGGDEVFLGYRPLPDWQHHQLDASDRSNPVRVGPGASPWMGSWAVDVTGNTLLGHMLPKVDRASAEQGVEVRCPLLDQSLMGYVRSLPADILPGQSALKQLLKQQLVGWPQWFLERRKLGFSYNLRWHWALSRFGGLREMVTQDAVDMFADRVPPPLRVSPSEWRTKDIFRHFGDAWRLMVWSAFVDRLAKSGSAYAAPLPAPDHGQIVRDNRFAMNA